MTASMKNCFILAVINFKKDKHILCINSYDIAYVTKKGKSI